MKTGSIIFHAINNFIGFHTNRKVIAFLSDDWGGVRIRSHEARERLIRGGFDMDSNRFDRFDMLESNTDLEYLFEVLLRHKDYKGNHPVITAVTCVANPDFKRIEEEGFSNYYYEPFIKTLERYTNHDRVFDLYKKGYDLGIFIPQLHGREHLQVKWWLRYLQEKNQAVCKAFNNEFWYVDPKFLNNSLDSHLDIAFSFMDLSELELQKLIVEEAAILFREIFGYASVLFTPPSQYYHNNLEKTFFNCGINTIDVPRWRKMPTGHGRFSTKFHYLGQRNNLGQLYLTRNSMFETNLREMDDGVDNCLSTIKKCFDNKIPAVISNHRVSFSGGLSLQNREMGLKALDKLLSTILATWPESEFLSVIGLVNLLHEGKD